MAATGTAQAVQEPQQQQQQQLTGRLLHLLLLQLLLEMAVLFPHMPSQQTLTAAWHAGSSVTQSSMILKGY
jgi:hypothetical protein